MHLERKREINWVSIPLRQIVAALSLIHIFRQAIEKTVEWSKAYLNGEDMRRVMDAQIKEF